MNTQQPEALLLADWLFNNVGHPNHAEAAAELRRLYSVNADLLAALQSLIDMDVAYQRGPKVEEAVETARAAIAKATKETK